MNSIKLIPDFIVEKIIPSNNIQKRSCIVRELLENSIDSKANYISLNINVEKDYAIEIKDNGNGMSVKDLELCHKKYYSSKINLQNDLNLISTLGYRGMGLYLISKVADIIIESKQNQNQSGSRIYIRNQKIHKIESVDKVKNGTSIEIRNISLEKKDTDNIIEEFKCIGYAHLDVKMVLSFDNQKVFSLEATNLRKRIVNMLGGRYNEYLVPVCEETDLVTITGFVMKPKYAKKTKSNQYLYINKRLAISSYLNRSIHKGFQNLIKKCHNPSFFIFLEINPENIDLNIGVSKKEFFLKDNKSISSIITSSIRKSLGQYNLTPSINFEQESSFNIDVIDKNVNIKEPKIKIDPDYNPFKND